MHIKRALEDESDDGARQKGDRQGGEEGNAEAIDQNDGDVAARHGEGAVREIDEIHQSERHREPGCEHEQQHAVGNSIEQNC